MSDLQARGVRVAMLEAEPVLTARAQLALIAWRDLCGERAVGMSLGPIPWRAIIAWCDRYRWAEAEDLVELVQSLDAEFLHRDEDAAPGVSDPDHAHGEERHRVEAIPAA